MQGVPMFLDRTLLTKVAHGTIYEELFGVSRRLDFYILCRF